MLTIRKIRVASSDWAAAQRTAKYVLDPNDAPAATLPAGEHGDAAVTQDVRPTAAWLGSPRMLDQLGVEGRASVESGALALALQGRHAVSGERVRTEGLIERDARDDRGRPLLDARGRRVKERVRGT